MGWANAIQVLGKEIGEIAAFILIYEGVHYDKDNQRLIFIVMTGLVLVIGLLVTCCMVKEKKVTRNYVKTEDGKVTRRKAKIDEDEDPDDSGDDVFDKLNPLPETADFIKGVSLNCWGKTKLLYNQTYNAIFGDVMTQFILYAFFVNAFMQAKVFTIVYLWLTSWSISAD